MSIAANLTLIKERIRQSAVRANRNPSGIKLIAVTKSVGVDAVTEAIAAGVTDIGENRIIDGSRKFALLNQPVSTHLIGSLQTNKVKIAITNFNLIHSVDRPALIGELAKQAGILGKQIEFLIQVNIAGELTKHGCNPSDLSGLLEQIAGFSNLHPVGLMTIAPQVTDPVLVRPVFRRLKELFDQVGSRYRFGNSWRFLSMGMSQDFEIAVEEGANLLRIGRAIFN